MRTFSDTMVEARQKEAVQQQAIRRQVAVRDLNVLDPETVEYQGTKIQMSKEAFKSLIKLIGMGQQFTKRFGETFSQEAAAQFVNRMKNAMLQDSSTITLVANPESRQIVAFQKSSDSMISNESFLALVDQVRDHGNMDVINWVNNNTTGEVSINIANPNAQFGITSLDEVFTAGVQMKNSPIGGIQIQPYVNRMWCSNGLVTPVSAESYELTNLSPDSMEQFFQHMNQLRKQSYVPTGFTDQVKQAVNTTASMAEMLQAHRMIQGYAGERSETWVPMRENESAYGRMGVDITNLTQEQLKNSKSNQSIWSLVNGVTHFATHGQEIIEGSKMNDSTASDLMVRAGNLLAKNWDFEHTVLDPFNGQSLEAPQVGSLLN